MTVSFGNTCYDPPRCQTSDGCGALIRFIAGVQPCIFPWFILCKQALSHLEFTANLAFICRKRELSIVMREAYRYCTNRVIHPNVYRGIIFSNSPFPSLQNCTFLSVFLSFILPPFFSRSSLQRENDQHYQGKRSLNS